MEQTETKKVKKHKVIKTYVVMLRGTKLLPRRRLELRADDIFRNAFGDIVLKRKKIVVATFNRESCHGCFERKVLKKDGKRKVIPKEINENKAD